MKKQIIITILALNAALLPISVVNADAPPREIVYKTFKEVMKRPPSPDEYDKYTELVIENGWRKSDLKRVLNKKKHTSRNRATHDDRDYGRNTRNYSDRDYYEKRRWVEYAFDDHLGRLPSKREMQDYCDVCLDQRYDRHELSRRISNDYKGKPKHRGNSHNHQYDYDRYSSNEEVEIIIKDIYKQELGRKVDDPTMRKYRRLMIDEGWSEKRVRNDIADNPQVLRKDLEKVVVRAYEDLLEERPGPRDRDYYVDQMLKHHWGERELRESIKNSREYAYERPRNLIEKAYQNVLLRNAENGAYALTGTIVRKDWNLQDVENHLRKSGEYRTKTIPKMLDIAYKKLLNRKPDTYGIGYYTERALEGWTFEEIQDHIRASDEYAERGTGK